MRQWPPNCSDCSSEPLYQITCSPWWVNNQRHYNKSRCAGRLWTWKLALKPFGIANTRLDDYGGHGDHFWIHNNVSDGDSRARRQKNEEDGEENIWKNCLLVDESVRIQITNVFVSEEDLETLKRKELPMEPFSKSSNRCAFGVESWLKLERFWSMTANRFKTDAVVEIVRPFRVNHGHQFVLADDNAPARRARVNAAFWEYDFIRLDWPGSPDSLELNSMEHAWDVLKRAVWNHQPPSQTLPENQGSRYSRMEQVTARNAG